MYQRILIATDGSEPASKAVAHGIALARDLKVPVSVVTVTEASVRLRSRPNVAARETRIRSLNTKR